MELKLMKKVVINLKDSKDGHMRVFEWRKEKEKIMQLHHNLKIIEIIKRRKIKIVR